MNISDSIQWKNKQEQNKVFASVQKHGKSVILLVIGHRDVPIETYNYIVHQRLAGLFEGFEFGPIEYQVLGSVAGFNEPDSTRLDFIVRGIHCLNTQIFKDAYYGQNYDDGSFDRFWALVSPKLEDPQFVVVDISKI